MCAKAEVPAQLNVGKWLEENQKHFLPPVCNKMMHNTQLKVFYVGGPNQRKDYHLEEGEELFYMRKGDMCLKIQEGCIFKDVHIKQGQIFLLPSRIPHSPQRESNTIGLVIERERMKNEMDGLRYFVEGSNQSLFERWFYCQDLGTQLAPVIKEFFESEQHKTGMPIASDMPQPAWMPDKVRRVEEPFNLDDWLVSNMEKINDKGMIRMFDISYQSDILVLGQTEPKIMKSEGGETFLWQLKGQSKVIIDEKQHDLLLDDTLLIPEHTEYMFLCDNPNSATLSTSMNPNNKSRIPSQA